MGVLLVLGEIAGAAGAVGAVITASRLMVGVRVVSELSIVAAP